MNVPNQLTTARLGFAVVLFALLTLCDPLTAAAPRVLLVLSFCVFVIAAVTDFLDGYLARRWAQESTFGRIADPFADKVLVCGTFIFFATPQFDFAGVASWMVVVIVARELLVSALRAESEAGGGAFGADWTGKLKMVTQSITIGLIFAVAAFEVLAGLSGLAVVLVWLTVLLTIASGLAAVSRAWRFLANVSESRRTADVTP